MSQDLPDVVVEARTTLSRIEQRMQKYTGKPVELVFHDFDNPNEPIVLPLEVVDAAMQVLKRWAMYYVPERDSHNIELTPEVIAAREAAEKMDLIDSKNKCGTFKMTYGVVEPVVVDFPEGFAGFMRESLYRLGEGFAGLNVVPVIPEGYTQPVTPVPTHNRDGWEWCPCEKCKARRKG